MQLELIDKWHLEWSEEEISIFDKIVNQIYNILFEIVWIKYIPSKLITTYTISNRNFNLPNFFKNGNPTAAHTNWSNDNWNT